MLEVCLSLQAWLYIKVLQYGQGVPLFKGLVVYKSMYYMAKVCLSVAAWLYINVYNIWRRCASVWRTAYIMKYVRYGRDVPQCVSKYIIYGQGVPQCGGLLVYQSMYDMAEVCLSVAAWLYIKVYNIWSRCASVWRTACISKYIPYGRDVLLCRGLILNQIMYDMTDVCLSVEALLYIKCV